MINEKINEMIKDAMKSKDQVRVETLRSVKAAFQNYQTAKDAKPLNEAAEIQILKKMVSSRQDAASQYKSAGREDLAAIEEAQIKILSEFLPAEVSKEEIEKAFIDTVAKLGLGKEKKNMGILIKALKEVYPGADGKLISEVVREGLNN